MLPELHAERQLSSIEAASVPHMEHSARKDVIRRHLRRSHAAGDGTVVARSAHEALLAAGIQPRYVPKRRRTSRDKKRGSG